MGSGFPSGKFCKPTKGELDPLVVTALQGRWPQVTAKDVRAEAAQTAK